MTKTNRRPAPARAPAPADRPGSRWSEAAPAPDPAPEAPPAGDAAPPRAETPPGNGHAAPEADTAALDERIKRGVAAAELTPEEEDAMRRRSGGDRAKMLAELSRIVKAKRAAGAAAAPAGAAPPSPGPEPPPAKAEAPALDAEGAARVETAMADEGVDRTTLDRVLADDVGSAPLDRTTRSALEAAARRVGLEPPAHTAAADLAIAVLTRLAKPAPGAAPAGEADLRAALARIGTTIFKALAELDQALRALDARGTAAGTAARPGNGAEAPDTRERPPAAEPPGLARDDLLKVVAEMRRANIPDNAVQSAVRDRMKVANLGCASAESIRRTAREAGVEAKADEPLVDLTVRLLKRLTADRRPRRRAPNGDAGAEPKGPDPLKEAQRAIADAKLLNLEHADREAAARIRAAEYPSDDARLDAIETATAEAKRRRAAAAPARLDLGDPAPPARLTLDEQIEFKLETCPRTSRRSCGRWPRATTASSSSWRRTTTPTSTWTRRSP